MAALLARNVLLFTLVERLSTTAKPAELDEQMKAVWDIFYHLYIPDADLGILQDHAERLLNASTSTNVWMSSQYGKFVHFLSESTLTRVRKCWLQYAETKNLTSTQKIALDQRARAAIISTYRGRIGDPGTKTLHGIRSAGAHFTNALETMPSAFEEYWRTGVAGGNERDKSSLGNDGKGWVNPMFAVSSAPTGTYAVHYGSDPLLGFHLAEAFDTTKSGGSTMDRVVQIAKSQFRSWCDIFVKTLEEGRVKIILHCGDAVSLCHKLCSQNTGEENLSKVPPLRISPWKSMPLVLNGIGCGPGPALFDVIDTSNLADHIGLLNVLPATVPLLSRKSSSVLYVENLLLASEDPSQSLRTMLCSDVSTMSLILGLSPIGHLLGVTLDSVGTEALNLSVFQQSPGRQRQYRIRVPWKIPELGDMLAIDERRRHPGIKHRVAFDAEQLGDYFFSLYLKMFAYEDCGAMMSSMRLTSGRRQIMSPLSGDLRYYTRLNLVTVLRLAKAHIITDWAKCMSHFVDKVQDDRQLPIGQNSVQELLLNLHMYGVKEDTSLKLSPLDLEIAATTSARSKSMLKILFQAPSPPSVIHVALVIPRSKLRIFTAESPDTIGTPGLHVSIGHEATGAENSFFAIQCFFGKLKPRADCSALCDVEEDGLGWSGSADLIVTCPVPAYTLLLGEADDVRVSLVVNTNPSTIKFLQKLGFRMVVYECGLEDEKRLWLLREAPGMVRHADVQPQVSQTDSRENSSEALAVFVGLDRKSEAKYLRFHADIPKDSDESKSLADGAKVIITQSSPFTMTLQIGTTDPRSLVFPFPVDGSAAKTKVARKSSWVDVSVIVAPALSEGSFNRNIFPVILDDSHPSVWGMSRVNIQQQPVIKVPGDFDWLHSHMGLTLSADERASNALKSPNRPSNGLLDLKESLNLLFQSFVGRNKVTKFKPVKGFRLVLNDDCDTIIFTNAICHDRNTSSILMDAYVVCLSRSRIQEMVPALQSVRHEELLSIKVSQEESVLWKQLMPCLAERCRQAWTHGKNCEYLARNRIPLSVAHGESPLCSCGEGKALDRYPTGAQYRGPAKFATRIAIPPIFAVPYVEPLVSESMLGDARARLAPAQGQRAQRPGNALAGPAAAKCDNCGTEKRGLKACVRCGVARYCNHTCQKAAWKEHKKICNK